MHIFTEQFVKLLFIHQRPFQKENTETKHNPAHQLEGKLSEVTNLLMQEYWPDKVQSNIDYLPQIKREDECLCCKASMKVDILQ